MTSELKHHGVKGQQWGVRHGPPYPIDPKNPGDITIKKGTHFKRLSLHQENASKGHAYVNYLKNDVHHYRGFFAAMLRKKDNTVWSIDLEAVEDMRAPSKQKRIETFLEMYKTDPLIAKEMGNYYKSDWHHFTPLPKAFYQVKMKKLKHDELMSKGYETFVRSIGGNEYIRGAYFNKLAEKGYNFVIDDCDAGKFGKEPSIIFDRTKSVKYNGQTEVNPKEIYKIWREEGSIMKELNWSKG